MPVAVAVIVGMLLLLLCIAAGIVGLLLLVMIASVIIDAVASLWNRPPPRPASPAGSA